MSEFKFIGKSVPRLDGPDKVTGNALFLEDRVLRDMPGAWVGGTVRSDTAYGRLRGIKLDPAFDWSKVEVLTAADLPAVNYVHVVRDDYPILAESTVNYWSQAVALVAAPDRQTLKRALSHIEVDIEPWDPVLTIEDSLNKKAVIWGQDNIVDSYRVNCGDLAAGFAASDTIVEGTYSTGLQEQLYLDTQGMAAIPRSDGGIELIGSVQCPYYVVTAVSSALGLEPSKVRVIQAEIGGGFGGKEDYPSMLGIRSAILARRIGKPVVMVYDRTEDLLVTPKRHPSLIRHKTGVRADGTIKAMEIDIILDAGAYTTLTMVILQRSTLHATGCYHVPNASIRGRAVATNTPPTGAFRGFGAPQAIFAVERQMDKIARVLDLDPLELRLKNIIKNGMSFPYKQVMDSGVCAEDVLLRAAERSDYRLKREQYAREAHEAEACGARCRHGIGISVALHGGGFTGAAEDTMGTTTKISYENGLFVLHTSCVDMGQGSSTVLPQIAAETLGVEIEKVTHPRPDTYVCPNSGPTVASRSTMFVGRVLNMTCNKLIDTLRVYLAQKESVNLDAIRFAAGEFCLPDGRIVTTTVAAELYTADNGPLSETFAYENKSQPAWDSEKFEGDAYKGYGWIAQAVEVEVDMDTYEINPTRATVVAEVGRAVNPILASGQLEGGVLQGFGWSHIEALSIDDKGRYPVHHMSEYLVPTALDAPTWDVEMLEVPSAVGPYGAKGIGELPANGGAPAFLAAVENATGIAADYIPLTGERLWAELAEKGRSWAPPTPARGRSPLDP